MIRNLVPQHRWLPAILVAALAGGSAARAAEAPRVAALRTQRSGQVTYFHVSFTRPRDLRLPAFSAGQSGTEAYKRALARLPSLVPQDARASLVYLLPDRSEGTPQLLRFPGKTLQFAGRVHATGKVGFRLSYPVERAIVVPANGRTTAETLVQPGWETADLTLDFGEAVKAPVPKNQGDKARAAPIDPADLLRLWAVGQAFRFAVLEVQSPDFGFFPFAREATGRKYNVPTPALLDRQTSGQRDVQSGLYELTTGALAMMESLQLKRLLSPTFQARSERTIPISSVPDFPHRERPWEKMLAGKKPVIEPLARLIPHDQLYIHFKDPSRFIDFIDLFEQFGNQLVNLYEINSREYDLRNRYDRQLCVISRGFAKTFAPLVVGELAVTGSDLFMRDGTDLAVVCRMVNRQLFVATLQPYVDAARKEFGSRLRETRTVYHGITLESYVSPLREISLHRAFLKDSLAVYSNSPVAIRRVLDTYQGRRRALADSPDFRYMRTVFPHADRLEDGFLFMSGAFIRSQVGAALKIKQKRRLEALTSMYMIAHAALFAAWENGKTPPDVNELLADAHLRPDEIYVPEGKAIAWDARVRLPVSDAYNTLRFATPLAEMPIDRITAAEEREYRRFRDDYSRRSGDAFDPIASRMYLGSREIRVETLMGPAVNNSWYDVMRLWTGNGAIEIRPSAFAPATLVGYRAHFNSALLDEPTPTGAVPRRPRTSVGEWLSIRIDDGPVYADLVKLLIRRGEESRASPELYQEAGRLFFRLPLTVGLGIRDPRAFQKQLDDYEDILRWLIGEFTVDKKRPAYKGIPITAVRFAADSGLARFARVNVAAKSRPLYEPVLYYAFIGDGWYLSVSESQLRGLIDDSIARLKPKKPEPAVAVNSSLYVAPAAAVQAGAALRNFLEWESRRWALANGLEWYTLFRCGLVDSRMTERQKFRAAMHYLGYVPTSPENASYKYDAKTDEVANARHGTVRRPTVHSDLDPASSLRPLLEQFRSFRGDLRFVPDGIHTIVTLDRNGGNGGNHLWP
jgi:hypothetical protein